MAVYCNMNYGTNMK